MKKRETIQKIKSLLRRGDKGKIAKAAGCSTLTLWRYLSDKEELSPEMEKKIQDVLQKFLDERRENDKSFIKKVDKW